MKSVVSNIPALKEKLPAAIQKCLAFFPGVDRTKSGYEGLIAAQDCLPNDTVRDAFAGEFNVLAQLWKPCHRTPSCFPSRRTTAGSRRCMFGGYEVLGDGQQFLEEGHALDQLFQQARKENTPAMVERIVKDIDEIVRLVRFPGWQQTAAGEREVKHGLRKTLLKYQLHQETELFDRAYGYVRQYY